MSVSQTAGEAAASPGEAGLLHSSIASGSSSMLAALGKG